MKRFLASGAIALTFISQPADAGYMATMTIKAQAQGLVKGSISLAGRKDSIGVIAVSHEIFSPRDPQSGLAAGKRMHKPFVFTKELDKSTPVLYKILVNNENLTEVVLKFWTAAPGGTATRPVERNHYTVKLTNANIASIKSVLPNVRDPAQVKFAEYEEIALTYQKIEWTWTDGGVTSMDSWDTSSR